MIQNFQYKITHRILACNFNLKIQKIRDNNLCESCDEIDTMECMFVQTLTAFGRECLTGGPIT
jgi:hypothetical protein